MAKLAAKAGIRFSASTSCSIDCGIASTEMTSIVNGDDVRIFEEFPQVAREGLSILLRVLYPVVPHTAWSLWNDLGFAAESGDLLDASWPQVDDSALVQEAIELVLQVNGKLRGKLVVPAAADRSAIEEAARGAAEVARHAGGAPVKKVVIVPGKLVNVVV